MKAAIYTFLGVAAFVVYGIATTPRKSIEERCSERFWAEPNMVQQCVTTAKVIKANQMLDQRDADIRSIASH